MSVSSSCCNWLSSLCKKVPVETSDMISERMSHNSIYYVHPEVVQRYAASKFPPLELSRTPIEPSSVSLAPSSVNGIPSDVMERYVNGDFSPLADPNSISYNEDATLLNPS